MEEGRRGKEREGEGRRGKREEKRKDMEGSGEKEGEL